MHPAAIHFPGEGVIHVEVDMFEAALRHDICHARIAGIADFCGTPAGVSPGHKLGRQETPETISDYKTA